MVLPLLLIACSCALYANNTRAQGILDKSVTLSVENMAIRKVITRVQQQTGVKFHL